MSSVKKLSDSDLHKYIKEKTNPLGMNLVDRIIKESDTHSASLLEFLINRTDFELNPKQVEGLLSNHHNATIWSAIFARKEVKLSEEDVDDYCLVGHTPAMLSIIRREDITLTPAQIDFLIQRVARLEKDTLSLIRSHSEVLDVLIRKDCVITEDHMGILKNVGVSEELLMSLSDKTEKSRLRKINHNSEQIKKSKVL